MDIRGKTLHAGLSDAAIVAIEAHLAKGQQVLVFLNRRGFAPVLLCHACGFVVSCTACDAKMTFHAGKNRLFCHHCEANRPCPRVCPECERAELIPIGQGTEQLEEWLATRFPQQAILRMDRDTVALKGARNALLHKIQRGEVSILVGTQMLAKGHHFPRLSLVVVVESDQGLLSADFRALERLGQCLTQVMGRAGRESVQGEVLIQTHCPAHPAWSMLLQRPYDDFLQFLLALRKAVGFPPCGFLVLWRAEAKTAARAHDFLSRVKQQCVAVAVHGLSIWGPIPAAMERKGGRYRSQLLLRAAKRSALQRVLDTVLPILYAERGSRVVWSVDVDPQDCS